MEGNDNNLDISINTDLKVFHGSIMNKIPMTNNKPGNEYKRVKKSITNNPIISFRSTSDVSGTTEIFAPTINVINKKVDNIGNNTIITNDDECIKQLFNKKEEFTNEEKPNNSYLMNYNENVFFNMKENEKPSIKNIEINEEIKMKKYYKRLKNNKVSNCFCTLAKIDKGNATFVSDKDVIFNLPSYFLNKDLSMSIGNSFVLLCEEVETIQTKLNNINNINCKYLQKETKKNKPKNI